MNNIIGIDIGTTHCKLVVVNRDNEVVFSVKKNCRSFTNDEGMHEQDAEEIFAIVMEMVIKGLEHTPPENISCISFSCAMHSILAIDEQGKPLMRGITWADNRAAACAVQLRQSPAATELFAQTGTPIHAMTPFCKLVWLKQEQPALFEKAYKFISLKEYIFNCLFDEYIIDEAMACGTGLFNLHTRQWNQASLEVAGITADKLSTIVSIFYAQNKFRPAIQQQLGLHAELYCIAGCSDGSAAQLGSGALGDDDVCITIGTSGAVRKFIHSPVIDAQQKIFTYILTDSWYFTGGPTNNGGAVLQWFAKTFLPGIKDDEVYEKIIGLAKASGPGAKGLLFIPYLNGERAPVWDGNATGSFTGIKNSHAINDFARAVIEGILLNLREIYNYLPAHGSTGAIYANGGFFNNAFMAQLLADIFGVKVLLQKDADSSCMGAVYVGMLAKGWITDIMEVRKFIVTDEVFTPDDKKHAAYKEVFEKYLEGGSGRLKV